MILVPLWIATIAGARAVNRTLSAKIGWSLLLVVISLIVAGAIAGGVRFVRGRCCRRLREAAPLRASAPRPFIAAATSTSGGPPRGNCRASAGSPVRRRAGIHHRHVAPAKTATTAVTLATAVSGHPAHVASYAMRHLVPIPTTAEAEARDSCESSHSAGFSSAKKTGPVRIDEVGGLIPATGCSLLLRTELEVPLQLGFHQPECPVNSIGARHANHFAMVEQIAQEQSLVARCHCLAASAQQCSCERSSTFQIRSVSIRAKTAARAAVEEEKGDAAEWHLNFHNSLRRPAMDRKGLTCQRGGVKTNLTHWQGGQDAGFVSSRGCQGAA